MHLVAVVLEKQVAELTASNRRKEDMNKDLVTQLTAEKTENRRLNNVLTKTKNALEAERDKTKQLQVVIENLFRGAARDLEGGEEDGVGIGWINIKIED